MLGYVSFEEKEKGEEELTSSANLLTGSRHTDDDALSPTFVTSLQRTAHNMHITRAVKRVIAATICHLDQLLLNALTTQLGRVDKVGSTELLSPLLLGVVDIDDNDPASLVLRRTLDDRETDTAGAEDGNVGSLLNTVLACCDDGRTVARRDTAAEKTGAVHGSLGGDGHDGDVRDNGVLREGRGAHEVEEVFALALEARSAVGHDTFALGRTNLAAEVGLAGFAELAFAAFGGAGGIRFNTARMGFQN